ncbi:MAG TPA: DUF1176 domain-containing protein [Rubricoccaceae bacterium]|nr:DUF1176 domain-containing protein [Rubricoccaceae bacterium]
MRPLLVAPLAALLACASEPASAPDPTAEPAPAPTSSADARTSSAIPADSLDVRAWLAEVRALDAQVETLDYDSLVARSRRLADRIDPVVGWRRACDTYNDPSTGEPIYDPVAPELEATIGRGVMDVAPLGEGEAAVSILCAMGAYQGSWALVHVEGDGVSLVRTTHLDENYRPTASEAMTFGEPVFEPDGRVFTTFTRSRGAGDCGAFTRYRLGTGGQAEILEVRARECGDEIEAPDELPPPTEWPVVYSAE